MNYKSSISALLQNFKKKHNYRVFTKIDSFTPPYINHKGKTILNWCNNDYNNLINNDNPINDRMISSIKKLGCGASGTRNISGTHESHVKLESKVAKLHSKERGLLFNSGYLANLATIQSFGRIFPGSIIYSDQDNHASIINGIQLSRLQCNIYPHNDLDHLEFMLRSNPNPSKIVILESIYSMDGSITDFDKIIPLMKKYNCLTYIDEIHAVGVYGNHGGGLTEMFGCQDEFDVIMGGFGKGFGIMGGYITGSDNLIDAVRLSANGFIFTTAIPPFMADGICESIDINISKARNNQILRNKKLEYFKQKAKENDIILIKNNFHKSHISSISIGCSHKCQRIYRKLLYEYNHYLQPIVYPTVPMGTERLRVCVKSIHTYEMIDDLINALVEIIHKDNFCSKCSYEKDVSKCTFVTFNKYKNIK